MTETTAVGEGKVSGNQASIPANIRRELGIEDGDVIRWRIVDGERRVELVRRRTGVFDDFEPGASEEPVDVVDEHDRFGVGS